LPKASRDSSYLRYSSKLKCVLSFKDEEMYEKPGYKALRKGRVSIPNQIYHLTTSTADRYPYFCDFNTARLLIRALNQSNVNTLAYVVMPDHFHWLIRLTESSPDLSTIMRGIKTGVSKNRSTRKKVMWQRGFYDRSIRKEEDLEAVARYIICNPIRAGITHSLREYPHWDAIWV